MTNTQHTPGPWEVSKMDNGYGFQIISKNPRVYVMGAIAANGAGINGVAGKALANARLIAAAPELLEALENLLTDVQNGELATVGQVTQARAAITKATGK